MSDNLTIFGETYLGVLGLKATDDNENVLTFYHAEDGDLLEYGSSVVRNLTGTTWIFNQSINNLFGPLLFMFR